ncbi:hypothetical protein EJ05DRAFT_502514 [Pseudovirgaria hyperparasitica]|uniref:Hemerythrin-like domain-containing protein n=1 Tax=Pseudovirgaria hyperparasitica TaxID=470096 RepID=A0A6A6W377_9PEZI|nr:uncharacterized protein EJ05DRAFT_502514 [Pseudovirgaria hyperparasitica]KAF2756047.1 hypothetical protein EJ05DRAFT_502514 [Pseudovirgaria hyperparasitica]
MTTKPSAAPWADEPFKLITLPDGRADITNKEHSAVYCATQMAQVHNFMIRGLNAIIQQAPHIPTISDPNYNEQDVKDLMKYVQIWIEGMEKHHHVEEVCIFPEIEKFAGKPGLMDSPKHQHETFTPGLEKLLKYCKESSPENYRWSGQGGMEELINDFSDALITHLYAEIDIFLSLKTLESAGLKKCWEIGEKFSQSEGFVDMLYTTFPMVLGTADKTYEGGTPFPPVPFIMPYIVHYWFAAGNSVWRFNPCDFWGKPRPLQFTSKS